MEGITGIWILDENGIILFNYELVNQGTEDTNSVLFQGLIISIQRFVSQLGEKKTERIELGNMRLFLSREEETKIVFVIKASKEANIKKVTKLIEKIQKDFIQSFKPYFKMYPPEDLRLYIADIFKTYIEKLLELAPEDRISEFFEKTSS